MSLLEFTVKEFHAQIDSAADSLEQAFVQLGMAGQLLHTVEGFYSIHLGHHMVQKDQVIVVFLNQLQAFPAPSLKKTATATLRAPAWA